jgi:secretion/DNA translocation related CpaE-like protein
MNSRVTAPAQTAVPLVVTADSALRERIALLCAAAGVRPNVVERLEDARMSWRSASGVIVGADLIGSVPSELSLARRGDVLVVATSDRPGGLWRGAMQLGAEDVLVLPQEQDRLVAWIGDLQDGRDRAQMFAVIGARGGAGASTFAVSLSISAARAGSVLLVDADPLSGGIDLVVGSEHRDGLRWPDVALTDGRLAASTLRDALPEERGVSVLSWTRGLAQVTSTGDLPPAVTPATMQAMLGAAQRSFEHVVVDVPRGLDATGDLVLSTADGVVVVCVDDVRSIAAASVLILRLRGTGADLGLVVRTTRWSATSPQAIADSLGVALVGSYRSRRSVARSVDDGFGPPSRGPLARCSARVLGRMRQGASA